VFPVFVSYSRSSCLLVELIIPIYHFQKLCSSIVFTVNSFCGLLDSTQMELGGSVKIWKWDLNIASIRTAKHTTETGNSTSPTDEAKKNKKTVIETNLGGKTDSTNHKIRGSKFCDHDQTQWFMQIMSSDLRRLGVYLCTFSIPGVIYISSGDTGVYPIIFCYQGFI